MFNEEPTIEQVMLTAKNKYPEWYLDDFAEEYIYHRILDEQPLTHFTNEDLYLKLVEVEDLLRDRG